jgi:hypothetical protein
VTDQPEPVFDNGHYWFICIADAGQGPDSANPQGPFTCWEEATDNLNDDYCSGLSGPQAICLAVENNTITDWRWIYSHEGKRD